MVQLEAHSSMLHLITECGEEGCVRRERGLKKLVILSVVHFLGSKKIFSAREGIVHIGDYDSA